MGHGDPSVARIIARHREDRSLIPVLQEIQQGFGYLPEPVLEAVAQELKIPLSQVYGVATFYSQFSLKPRGKHLIRVCLGTACHVRGAPQVLEELMQRLKVNEEGVSEELGVAVEPVRCLGACALAPVVVAVNGKYYGGMTPTKVRTLLPEILGETNGQARPS